MNYLAIDTSGDLLVVVNKGEKQTVKRLIGSQTKHSLSLMPYIEEALEESGLDLFELDFFAVVIGPGSFTGIRIGVATVKALCFACGKKVLPLTSFDLIAYSNNALEKSFCVIDANHDNYYCCEYDKKEITLKPCFLNKEDIQEKAKNLSICSLTEVSLENVTVCDCESGMINAINAKKKDLCDYNQIEPLYVKRSQAEEESC